MNKTTHDEHEQKKQDITQTSKQKEREDKRAAALRDNLRRRKSGSKTKKE